jgi:hypothetical protein
MHQGMLVSFVELAELKNKFEGVIPDVKLIRISAFHRFAKTIIGIAFRHSWHKKSNRESIPAIAGRARFHTAATKGKNPRCRGRGNARRQTGV